MGPCIKENSIKAKNKDKDAILEQIHQYILESLEQINFMVKGQ